VYRYIFWVSFQKKSKGYDAVMKRPVKEYHLGIRDILRNQRISSKRASMN
jgi:hypothetical protein